MILLVQASVLTVGIGGKSEVLEELPIRVIEIQSGADAARSLKNEKVNSVISNWHLVDMRDGKFLKALRNAKPDLPTIAIVQAGNHAQEIAARSLGVSAVLTDKDSNEYFLDIVCEVLGLRNVTSIKAISAVDEENRKN